MHGVFKEYQSGLGAGVELARGNDISNVMERDVGFCRTFSFSLSEESSGEMMSYQDLAAMLRINC